MLRISNIKLNINHQEKRLQEKAARCLHAHTRDIQEIRIVKKSIDARDKNNIHFVYTLDIEISDEEQYAKIKNVLVLPKQQAYLVKRLDLNNQCRPVIVGSGPSGLFAALILAEAGLCPVILERGKAVAERKRDVDLFWQKGILNENSNVQFGEGGAGTFSDGKLTTGINDPRIQKVLAEFAAAGAPAEILYTAKPHIGTDKLVDILVNIRRKITDLGGEFRFSQKLVGINYEHNTLQGIEVLDIINECRYHLETHRCILAIGHSARDTFEFLYKDNIKIQPKAFSVGVRIEHKQALIDYAQYGKNAGHPQLGAADYKLAVHLKNGRGVYTFCMCPGGAIVASSSEAGGVVTNGMSNFARDGVNANSALLVSVTPEDFPGADPLAGISFQRDLEKRAFLLGGSSYKAPCQCVGDFLSDRPSKDFMDVSPSYLPGVVPADLRDCLPGYAVESLKLSLIEMNKKIKGFAGPGAVMTGVETRSSSPVRIVRDIEFQSNVRGLYPCGEGAGYAGGILSAAVDGIKSAEAVMTQYLK